MKNKLTLKNILYLPVLSTLIYYLFLKELYLISPHFLAVFLPNDFGVNHFKILLVLNIFSILYTFINRSFQIKVFAILLFVLINSIVNSGGVVHHDYHLLTYLLIIELFLPFLKNKINVQRFCQKLIFASYLAAGIWKIRNFSRWITFKDWYDNYYKEVFSFVIIQGFTSVEKIKYLFGYGDFMALKFLMLMGAILHVTTVIPIVLNRYFRVWGIGLILFHLSVGYLMGIWFLVTIYLLINFIFFKIDFESS